MHQGDVAERACAAPQCRAPRARTDDDAPPTDWLAELPHELLLRILEGVDDFSDCAAFSLASPRLGLLEMRSAWWDIKESEYLGE